MHDSEHTLSTAFYKQNDHTNLKDESNFYSTSRISGKKVKNEIKMKENYDILDECMNDLKTLVTVKIMNGKKPNLKGNKATSASDPLGTIESPEDILNIIEIINSKLLELDQLRYILKEQNDIKCANDGIQSLINSFKRFALFLTQKLEEIDNQNLARQRELQIAAQKAKFEEDCESPDLAKQKVNEHTTSNNKSETGNLLDDIDNDEINNSEHHDNIEIERQAEDIENEMEEDEEESMSLKDVIMTLNDFYASKLDGVLTLMNSASSNDPPQDFDKQLEAIEKVVKDNEVRIPYDEDIFIGIDKNYKILKKILERIKDKYKSDKKID